MLNGARWKVDYMSNKLLLDTCALIWYLGKFPMENKAIQAIEARSIAGDVFMNPVSAWEISMLISKSRLSLSLPVEAWFEKAQLVAGLKLKKIPLSVLISAPQLPGSPPKDPVDSIMIAIAREKNMTLVTRDKEILDYGNLGYVRVLPC